MGAQMIVKALEAVRGNADDKPAFLAAMKKVEIDAPRGPVHLDDYNNPVQTVYVLRTERKNNQLPSLPPAGVNE